MDEELANEILDDMNFFNNKVKCRKVEGMMPKLMKMVEGEEKKMRKKGGGKNGIGSTEIFRRR